MCIRTCRRVSLSLLQAPQQQQSSVPLTAAVVGANRALSLFGSAHSNRHQHQQPPNVRLQEVGYLGSAQSLMQQRVHERYRVGQTFLHKVFGYRGIVLFRWKANVFERKSLLRDPIEDEQQQQLSRIHPKRLNYYQVLVDERDMPHMNALHSASAMFISGPRASASFFSIKGFDYVSHVDILPYASSERPPIVHSWFEKLMQFDSLQKSFVGRVSLKSWQDSNHSWLELSDVSISNTDNIKVTAIPFYVGAKEDLKGRRVFWWRYSIRVDNLKPHEAVTVREHKWKICSDAGLVETIEGRGIVHKVDQVSNIPLNEPNLNASTPVFQFSSLVRLQASSGHMWGWLRVQRENGEVFDVSIPSFKLECKDANEKM